MAASFKTEGLEANSWRPVIEGIDYTERMLETARALGESACTVWVHIDEDDTGGEVIQQCTPENTRLMVSMLDDDSDCIMIKDPRDGQFFKFFRGALDGEMFDRLLSVLQPWSVNIASMTPDPESMKMLLDRLARDVHNYDCMPEDW